MIVVAPDTSSVAPGQGATVAADTAAALAAATAKPAEAAAPVALELGDKAPVVPAVAGTVPSAEPFTYDLTGDVGLDYALNYVGKLGFGADHPAIVAAMAGEFSLIEAELAQKGDKALGYKEVIGLARAAHVKHAEKATQSAAALSAHAVTAAGSEARWGEVRTWASANATPEEKAQVNAALAAGGMQAKATINYLVSMFDKSSSSSQDPQRTVAAPTAGNSAGAAGGPLSADGYRVALRELQGTMNGRDPSTSPLYKGLQARRLAGMGREG